MYKVYFSLATLLFISCSTKIRYVGNTYPSTRDVDVYVTENSIKKPFNYVGKGYVAGFGPKNPEKVAAKSIQKARKMGADAILILDYYVPYTGTSMNSVYTADSIGKRLITTGNTQIVSTGTTGYNILFIRYQ